MTETDFAAIESTLGTSLPHEYRDFLLHHSAEVRRIKELQPFLVVPWTDPAEIIRQNLRARKLAEFMPVGEDGEPWPENWLVVGTNGAGDYWFIDCDEAIAGLWIWWHESQEVTQKNGSFEEYLNKLRCEA